MRRRAVPGESYFVLTSAGTAYPAGVLCGDSGSGFSCSDSLDMLFKTYVKEPCPVTAPRGIVSNLIWRLGKALGAKPLLQLGCSLQPL